MSLSPERIEAIQNLIVTVVEGMKSHNPSSKAQFLREARAVRNLAAAHGKRITLKEAEDIVQGTY